MVSASDPPEVKITSLGCAPTARASSSRASSSAARARWPGRCSEDGFPTIHAASVQAASASGRSGDVAAWSR